MLTEKGFAQVKAGMPVKQMPAAPATTPQQGATPTVQQQAQQPSGMQIPTAPAEPAMGEEAQGEATAEQPKEKTGHMKRNVIIIVVILLILAAVGYLWYTHQLAL